MLDPWPFPPTSFASFTTVHFVREGRRRNAWDDAWDSWDPSLGHRAGGASATRASRASSAVMSSPHFGSGEGSG